ncbi:cytochrome d ubiquinol oxidase subunit II [Silvanigrella paludirubra]|uniref:Cytochrome d ubiquinol oxidase subunit II n=1 Tax=Silvanigrella paludirubra TaxID=2499159 RepID=A0A6N6VVY8_9BACT|nr:cytochrome d ubiquinol oxidase subunit II [Silvanigrella paludirubra]KAB8039919.1 cytochrome d ubiquinol oxidase subunit II [Silvanigrella paludirubra]
MDLNIFWFVTLGILLAGYAVLDGFDLGVGILHPLAKTDHEKRLFLNSIGPFWDGNEVWLVTFGGALFAAFPDAYATAFSGFYLPFMLLLCALIFRAVSIEFRSKHDSPIWRAAWDWSFFGASVLATFLFGVAVGNCLNGILVGADKEYAGTVLDLLNPYSIAIGILAVATFAMHGSIFLYLKLEGELKERVHRWIWHTFGCFIICYILATIYTLVSVPRSIHNFENHPWLWGIVILNVLAIANIPRAVFLGRPGYAFLSSSLTLIAFTALFGAALFPNLITSNILPEYSLTIYNSASSEKTLNIMRIIAFCGMPFVISYTAIIYWVFRGKVKLGKFSY